MENYGELAIFENKNFGKVRGILRDNVPWFVALDIAVCLGYSNPSRSVQDHCKHAELLKTTDFVAEDFPSRGMLFIPESDVYRLLMRSNMPKAVEFQDWIAEEVLPSILNTGSYSIEGKKQLTTQEKVNFLKDILKVAEEHGCYRALAVNELILHDTGCDILEEAGQNVLDTLGKPEYTPKQIAKILGHGYSATAVDFALARMGLQEYGINYYHLTEKGAKYGAVYETRKPRGFAYVPNIKWHPIIIDKLRMHFHLDAAKALEQPGNSHFRMLLNMKSYAK